MDLTTARVLLGATELDLFSILLLAGGAFFAAFAAWLVLRDRRASLAAALRPQPIRRGPSRPFRLPPADETRLSVARFRRVIGEWLLLEHEAERLRRRVEALERRAR